MHVEGVFLTATADYFDGYHGNGSFTGFAAADVKSGATSLGHRFLSKGPITLEDGPSHYVEDLRANFVILREDERLDMIVRGIRKIEAETGGRAVKDDDLVREILDVGPRNAQTCVESSQRVAPVP